MVLAIFYVLNAEYQEWLARLEYGVGWIGLRDER